MKIHSYKMYSNAVEVVLTTGEVKTIFFNQNSGKVYYRYKKDTVMQVKHTGIFIGTDRYGTQYWIHNHYKLGSAHLVTGYDFTLGMPIYIYNEKCVNAWNVVISKGFQHVLRQETFKMLTYNCQTMTNDSCNNQRTSADAGKVFGGVALFVILLAIFGGK